MLAVVFGGFIVAVCFGLGWGETTRKGIPVWLLGVVGIGGFVAVGVQSWRKPRRRPSDGR